MKEIFSYINKRGEKVHVLVDEYEENSYILNEDTLEVFRPSFVDGVLGMMNYVDEEIEEFWSLSERVCKDIFSFIEDSEIEEDYSNLYSLLLIEMEENKYEKNCTK